MAEMRTRIAEAAFNGELTFYKDAKTKRKSKDKKLRRVYWITEQEVSDELHHSDSSFVSVTGPAEINKWILYSEKSAPIGSWNQVSSVGFSCRYIYEKGKSIWKPEIIIDKDSVICYVKAEDITPMLRPDERRLLDKYFAFSSVKKSPVILQDSTLMEMAEDWYRSCAHQVFTAADNGQVKVYSSDSFTRFYSQEFFKKVMQNCRVVNPYIPGPVQIITYPGGTFLAQDIYDSTVCWNLTADSMLGFSFAYEWTMTEEGPLPKLKSIGLMYYRYVSGVHLPVQFWMPSEEIKKIVQAEDWLLLTDIFNSHLILTLNHDGFYREGNGYY
jgi:hypothetical protein